jgi:hypothetical protein
LVIVVDNSNKKEKKKKNKSGRNRPRSHRSPVRSGSDIERLLLQEGPHEQSKKLNAKTQYRYGIKGRKILLLIQALEKIELEEYQEKYK